MDLRTVDGDWLVGRIITISPPWRVSSSLDDGLAESEIADDIGLLVLLLNLFQLCQVIFHLFKPDFMVAALVFVYIQKQIEEYGLVEFKPRVVFHKLTVLHVVLNSANLEQ